MENLFPDLEKTLHTFLKYVRNKLDTEKNVVESILKNFHWHTVDVETSCSCAAVDSSFLAIESRIGYIYAIQGIAAVYDMENGIVRQVCSSIFSDMGFINVKPTKKYGIVHRSLYKKVLAEYAYMLELKNVLNVVKKRPCDLILMDGSLASFIVNRSTKDFDISIESVAGVLRLNEVESEKSDYLTTLSSKKYSVFVAKSSNAGFYTQGLCPDMYVLELARLYKLKPYSDPGFLEPLVLDAKLTLFKLVKSVGIPIDIFTVTYARFREGIPVYQLSLPYKATVDEVKYVYSCVKKWSAPGYPTPLEYVHRFSKLPRKSLINAMMFLGIPIASGREIIEVR